MRVTIECMRSMVASPGSMVANTNNAGDTSIVILHSLHLLAWSPAKRERNYPPGPCEFKAPRDSMVAQRGSETLPGLCTRIHPGDSMAARERNYPSGPPELKAPRDYMAARRETETLPGPRMRIPLGDSMAAREINYPPGLRDFKAP